MPRKSEQEWMIIENDYVTKPVKFDELAKIYNISRQALIARSIKKDWHMKRDNYLTKTLQHSQSDIIKRDINDKESILNQIEKLIKLKSKAELAALTKYFELTDDGKSISPTDLMKLINKSKDGIAELTKVSELLKGNATDRVDFREEEKQDKARKERLAVLGFN